MRLPFRFPRPNHRAVFFFFLSAGAGFPFRIIGFNFASFFSSCNSLRDGLLDGRIGPKHDFKSLPFTPFHSRKNTIHSHTRTAGTINGSELVTNFDAQLEETSSQLELERQQTHDLRATEISSLESQREEMRNSSTRSDSKQTHDLRFTEISLLESQLA